MLLYTKPSQIFIICISLHTLGTGCNASDLIFLSGSREAGLANAGTTLGGLWSVYHNPAGMAMGHVTSFGFNYENRFLIKELNIASFAGVIPSHKGAFGISYSYFGSSLYSEKKYAFGYAHLLTENLSAGVLFDYYSTTLPSEYENSGCIAGEAGILATPLEKLSIGFHIANITSSKYKAYYNEDLPQYFRTGVSWKEEYFMIVTQIQLGKNHQPIISAGTEINFIKSLSFRFGTSTSESMRMTWGLGYNQRLLQVNIAFMHHTVLGLSSSLSLLFRFSKK